VLGVCRGQLEGDGVPPVAALGAVAAVAEPVHQFCPGPGDALDGPAAVGCGPGQCVARQVREHQVQCGGGVFSVGAGVGEGFNDVQELHDRPGPAVCHDHRQRVRLWRAHVQEVHGRTIDAGGELREVVEVGFGYAPVVPGPPPVHEVLQMVQGNAAGPTTAGRLTRPADAGETVLQVVQLLLRYLEPEGPDSRFVVRPIPQDGHHGCSLTYPAPASARAFAVSSSSRPS
jgi:hypothetical protein